MKKLISLIMSVVMCLSFVACAGETDANSGTESSSTGSQQQQTENTDYVTAIHFKINPEFEIRLDAGNIVVAVECMNEDAKTVFSGVDVVGMEALDAVETLLTAVFGSGQIKEAVAVYVLPTYQKENPLAGQLIYEIPDLVLNVKEKTGFSYDVTVEMAVADAENTADSNTAENTHQETETQQEDTSQTQSKPYKQNMLYRADFDIPDVHGTGYTNLIDYYNAYPDGKDGGTFANASLMVHYRDDMDKDMSVADSFAFRTYRGIGLGSSQNEVFAAYGAGTIEPPFAEIMGIGDANHTVSSFVEYRARIASGACVGIRFYFDQNNTVMFIDYNAVYLKYAGNVSDSALLPLV